MWLISNQKHPRCKKGWPRTKTGLAEKDVKSNGRPMSFGFDRLESFGHDELTAEHCYSRCSSLLMLMGSKVLIKMTRPHCIKIKKCFAAWSTLSKILILSTSEALSTAITMFCSEFFMTKTLKPIKTRRHLPPIWFHIFFSKACFSSWPPLFYTWGVFD